MNISFSRSTVKELEQHLQRAFQESDIRRIKRISGLLLWADGVCAQQIGTRLGVCVQTVYNGLHGFVHQRFASFRRSHSPGRPTKLKPTQKKRLCELIKAGPEACGYPTGCWNTALIGDLIQREFKRTYNVHYLSTLLGNLGFSYQKGRFVSDHLDEVARQKWLSETWPAILAEAKQRHALLLFADEASFAQWGSLGFTWAPRGQQPLIKTCGKRKAYKVMGLVDYFSGRLFFQGQTERFNSQRYCDFLEKVLAQTSQPVIVIQDGARYHTAKATKQFAKQQGARLTIYQLPSYSPDYNPIEHLWRNIKRQKTHNRYFETFEYLTNEVEAALRYFQNHDEEVIQLMGTHLKNTLDIKHAA